MACLAQRVAPALGGDAMRCDVLARAESAAASIMRARKGRRSSRLFRFACVFFWQRALTLDFFIAKRCTYKFRIVVERPPLAASDFSAFGRREEFSAVAFASAPHGPRTDRTRPRRCNMRK